MLGYYKHTLVDLFGKVQVVHACPWESLEECYQIQQVLLRRITYAERRIRHLRAGIAEAKQQLRMRPTRGEARVIKDAITDRYETIDQYRKLIFLFRCVGDALAHCYIPTWDVKPMAFKGRAQK